MPGTMLDVCYRRAGVGATLCRNGGVQTVHTPDLAQHIGHTHTAMSKVHRARTGEGEGYFTKRRRTRRAAGIARTILGADKCHVAV